MIICKSVRSYLPRRDQFHRLKICSYIQEGQIVLVHIIQNGKYKLSIGCNTGVYGWNWFFLYWWCFLSVGYHEQGSHHLQNTPGFSPLVSGLTVFRRPGIDLKSACQNISWRTSACEAALRCVGTCSLWPEFLTKTTGSPPRSGLSSNRVYGNFDDSHIVVIVFFCTSFSSSLWPSSASSLSSPPPLTMSLSHFPFNNGSGYSSCSSSSSSSYL